MQNLVDPVFSERKQCSGCKRILDRSMFHAITPDRKRGWSQSKDGLRARCRECRHRENTSEVARAAQRRYAAVRRERDYEREGIRLRRSHLRHKYGLDEAAFAVMHLAAHGACQLCGKKCPSGESHGMEARCGLAVDHDHSTTKPRGVLCRKCNSGLGLLCDDADLLVKAIAYLRRHEETKAEA